MQSLTLSLLVCFLSVWQIGWDLASAGILEQSMGARNRVGIRLSYRPAKLQMLAEIDDSWAP